ncbi:MAG: hypothetical protein PHY78_07255 [Desulfobacterales bacterium]|nr:hypothetical protein [Desulfobacterales bacterium]
MVYKLIHQYGYQPDEIDLEKSVQFGTEVGTKAAGIIVYTDATKETPKIIRGQDINDFFIENADPIRIPKKNYDTPMMQRSHFLSGDVLLSIVGTIGSLSLVSDTIGEATGSCKIAILRSKRNYSPFCLAAFLMSKFGQLQIKRNTRGAVQMGLILKDLSRIRVPKFSEADQTQIETIVKKSIWVNRQSKTIYAQAQHLLESELVLDKLRFQKPVGYTARFSEMEQSRRMDAQHYQPQFSQLLSHLAYFKSKRIRDIRTYNRRGLQPVYFEHGPIDVVNSQHLGPQHIIYDGLQKASETAFAASSEGHIQMNDLLVYTTGAYIGRTNVYLRNAPALASNHVNILRLNSDIDAAYMTLVFQSIVGQFQTQKYLRGSAQAELYPTDIDWFVVPLIDSSKQIAIGDLVRDSLEKQQESKCLLEQAKTRVEQLIEEAVRS